VSNMGQPLPHGESLSPAGSARERLESWKEIAAYLKRDVRTVQRWEKTERLPVYRHMHGERGTAYAFRTEIDDWWHNRQPRLEEQPETPVAVPLLRSWVVRSATALVALALIVLLYVGGSRFRSHAKPLAGKATLVVLPFENLTGDPQQEYFSDGLTEEIITQLGGLNPQQLAVIARTSAMHYRNTQETVAQIGGELGVDYILEGSVRRDAQRVRVSAQLIRVKDQMHLWAKSFDRDQHGILALESELSYAVADQIAIQLTPATKDRAARIHTVNADAYEAYLKGRYFLYKRNAAATRKAFDYFHQAVQYDPNLAAAYVGIGDCYFAGVGPTGHDAFVQAESFAQKALTIDETIAWAHSTIAYARMHEFDWPAADREFRRASELDPGNPPFYYVEFLMSQGRFEETLALAERGAREDPVAIIAVHGLGMVYFYARRYDDALGAFRKALELDPNYFWSLLRRAQTKEQLGRIGEATAEFEELGPKAEVFLARAYALTGKTQSARQILGRILSDPNRTKELTYEIALLYAGLKENDKALDWLERAYNDRSYHMIYIKIDPRLDPLRANPRFAALVRRVGLS
jgi:TolB-like protein